MGYDVIATDLPIFTGGALGKNIASNRNQIANVSGAGSVQCLPLDWMTAAQEWSPPIQEQRYDLIFSSDSSKPKFSCYASMRLWSKYIAFTVYDQMLVKPLLQTILGLCTRSTSETTSSPDIYIAYEHRDDAQYTSFTQQAEAMGFKVKVVPKGKVGKAVTNLYGWKSEDYEGITVLYLKLKSAN